MNNKLSGEKEGKPWKEMVKEAAIHGSVATLIGLIVTNGAKIRDFFVPAGNIQNKPGAANIEDEKEMQNADHNPVQIDVEAFEREINKDRQEPGFLDENSPATPDDTVIPFKRPQDNRPEAPDAAEVAA